jgi:hypothetical protein
MSNVVARAIDLLAELVKGNESHGNSHLTATFAFLPDTSSKVRLCKIRRSIAQFPSLLLHASSID